MEDSIYRSKSNEKARIFNDFAAYENKQLTKRRKKMYKIAQRLGGSVEKPRKASEEGFSANGKSSFNEGGTISGVSKSLARSKANQSS